MPGPTPKPLNLRQRQNKSVTRATLVVDNREIEIPPLPPYPKEGGDWEPLAIQWWEDVWTSPMAAEYLPSDFHPLLRLAYLTDKFWKKPSNGLAAEIRMLERDFGLSPLNRRRLEWSVVQAEDAKDKHNSRRIRESIPSDFDPREALG